MCTWENIEENAQHLNVKYCEKIFAVQTAKQKNVVGLPVKISLKSVGCWRKEKEEKNEQTKSSKRI